MQVSPDVDLLGPAPVSRRGSILLWVITAGLLSVLWYFTWRAGIGTPGNGWGGLFILSGAIIAFAAFLQYGLMTEGHVILSVEGVRRQKGSKSKFIPWLGSTVMYDQENGVFTVKSGKTKIVFSWASFSDVHRYQDIMEYIRYVIYEQSYRRHKQTQKIDAPIHSLSATDKAEFLNYRGDGFLRKIFWPYLSLPVLAVCLTYLGFMELLIYRPPVSPDVRHAINFILHNFPAIFQRPLGPFAGLTSILASLYIVLDRVPAWLSRGALRRFRSHWLQQFDKTQRIAISEIGLTHHDADGVSFWIWNDIPRISEANGLILFHLVPTQTQSVVVPKRIFVTPADAAEFYRRACDFKRTALTQPNVFEPISFWEIA